MDHNTVSEANDAISANWSKGTEFADNKITKSGSGVHTDNNGGSGGSADVIKGNKVSECKLNGYGIFVFVPYVSATVEDNMVRGCTVGLAAFGGAVSGQGPTFAANKVDGAGASTERRPDLRRVHHHRPARLRVRRRDRDADRQLDQGRRHRPAGHADQPQPGTAGRRPGERDGLGQRDLQEHDRRQRRSRHASSKRKNNWWGCMQGPTGSKCNPAKGTVNYTPWLATKP